MGYWYGKGDLFIGTRDSNGLFQGGRKFHCPSFEVSIEEQRLQHKNTSGAVTALDLDVAIESMPKVTFQVDTLDESVLAMALAGAASSVATGNSFSAKMFPTGIAIGDVVPVPGGYSKLASLTITDSAGSPLTLTAGTQYTVDLAKGLVTFLAIPGTQPYKAAGAESDAYKAITLATVGNVERFLRFSGVNLADGSANKPFSIDIFRASINANKVAFKSNGTEVTSYEFAPQALLDPNAPFSGVFGQYGRLVYG